MCNLNEIENIEHFVGYSAILKGIRKTFLKAYRLSRIEMIHILTLELPPYSTKLFQNQSKLLVSKNYVIIEYYYYIISLVIAAIVITPLRKKKIS